MLLTKMTERFSDFRTSICIIIFYWVLYFIYCDAYSIKGKFNSPLDVFNHLPSLFKTIYINISSKEIHKIFWVDNGLWIILGTIVILMPALITRIIDDNTCEIEEESWFIIQISFAVFVFIITGFYLFGILFNINVGPFALGKISALINLIIALTLIIPALISSMILLTKFRCKFHKTFDNYVKSLENLRENLYLLRVSRKLRDLIFTIITVCLYISFFAIHYFNSDYLIGNHKEKFEIITYLIIIVAPIVVSFLLPLIWFRKLKDVVMISITENDIELNENLKKALYDNISPYSINDNLVFYGVSFVPVFGMIIWQIIK